MVGIGVQLMQRGIMHPSTTPRKDMRDRVHYLTYLSMKCGANQSEISADKSAGAVKSMSLIVWNTRKWNQPTLLSNASFYGLSLMSCLKWASTKTKNHSPNREHRGIAKAQGLVAFNRLLLEIAGVLWWQNQRAFFSLIGKVSLITLVPCTAAMNKMAMVKKIRY